MNTKTLKMFPKITMAARTDTKSTSCTQEQGSDCTLADSVSLMVAISYTTDVPYRLHNAWHLNLQTLLHSCNLASPLLAG